jgi:hypothetical protein
VFNVFLCCCFELLCVPTAMKAQRRVLMALQNLLHEIAVSDGSGAAPSALPLPAAAALGFFTGAGAGGAGLANKPSGKHFSGSVSHQQKQKHHAVGHSQSVGNLTKGSLSTTFSTQLAGMNIPNTGTGGMGSTAGGANMSALTSSTGRGTGSRGGGQLHSHSHRQTPNTDGEADGSRSPFMRESYADILDSHQKQQFPLQHQHKEDKDEAKGYHYSHEESVAYDLHNRHLLLNANHAQTPSYFSPMVSGIHSRPASAMLSARGSDRPESESKDTYGGGGGIAGVMSVVTRGAWHSGAGNTGPEADSAGVNAEAKPRHIARPPAGSKGMFFAVCCLLYLELKCLFSGLFF